MSIARDMDTKLQIKAYVDIIRHQSLHDCALEVGSITVLDFFL